MEAETMNNIQILKYSTNIWLTSQTDIKTSLHDILINNSTDYSYNKSCARLTVKKFKIKI